MAAISDALLRLGTRQVEAGRVPDRVTRFAIRRMLRQRLAEAAPADFVERMRAGPIALVPDLANDQHYEVPAEFFQIALGPRLKYSCALFPPGVDQLGAAEECMLAETAARAQIKDGMRVLDLGCGWGSVSLYLAERFPDCQVVGVSNSKSQREHILSQAKQRGLENMDVLTADMNRFEAPGRFDRVVSVEMFEHMRNWERLLGNVSRWLEADGRAFLHVFCHRSMAYPYQDEGESDWMARNFFSGGLMPSYDLIDAFDRDLRVEQRWAVSGRHYAATCKAWLRNVDARRGEALKVLAETYGEADADVWLQRWRMFFLACAELFAYGGGEEWFVAHYRLTHAG